MCAVPTNRGNRVLGCWEGHLRTSQACYLMQRPTCDDHAVSDKTDLWFSSCEPRSVHHSAFPLNPPHLAFKTEVPISDRCFSSQGAEMTLGREVHHSREQRWTHCKPEKQSSWKARCLHVSYRWSLPTSLSALSTARHAQPGLRAPCPAFRTLPDPKGGCTNAQPPHGGGASSAQALLNSSPPLSSFYAEPWFMNRTQTQHKLWHEKATRTAGWAQEFEDRT